MHDPMTVAHEIKYPWWHHKPWPKQFRDTRYNKHAWKRMTPEQQGGRSSFWPDGYRNTFITIWHVDPQKDGSDDSCGYSYPKITKKQQESLRNAAWWEGHEPHFLICRAKEWTGTVQEAEHLHRGLVLLVCRVLKIKLTYDQVCRYSAEAVHIRTGGKFGSTFCFLPGYHTNSETDSEERRVEHFHGILCNVARGLLDLKRPWWKHPKWHFWHWKFQCLPLLLFKRWAFSRCATCGGRFRFGESAVTNTLDSTGPMWFRSERDVHCEKCHGVAAQAVKAEPINACNG